MINKVILMIIGIAVLLFSGCLIIDVIPELENPFIITFSGVREYLPQGTEMKITAHTIDEYGYEIIPESYEWYLNGEEIPDAEDDTVQVGPSLELGIYWLDLIVQKDRILSSERVIFWVVEP